MKRFKQRTFGKQLRHFFRQRNLHGEVPHEFPKSDVDQQAKRVVRRGGFAERAIRGELQRPLFTYTHRECITQPDRVEHPERASQRGYLYVKVLGGIQNVEWVGGFCFWGTRQRERRCRSRRRR